MKRALIVDGYNILGAWKEGAARAFEDARDALADNLLDYAGYTAQSVVLVFDGHHSGNLARNSETRGALSIVYTRRGETADQYIERYCRERAQQMSLGRLELRVASSDLLEQTIVLGTGATRVSARELLLEMSQARHARGKAVRAGPVKQGMLLDRLPEDVREQLERMRRGQR